MSEIGYDSFADYILKKEKYRKNFVKSIKKRGAYDPRTDFYLQFRRSLKKACKNCNLNLLDEMLSKLTNSNKKSGYPILVAKIKEFLISKNYAWAEPVKKIIQYDDLLLRVNPELGLELGDTTYFIKLYLKKPKITVEKINILKKIMQEAYSETEGNIQVGILDVRSGNLYSIPINQTMKLSYDLTKEASSWSKAWNELDA